MFKIEQTEIKLTEQGFEQSENKTSRSDQLTTQSSNFFNLECESVSLGNCTELLSDGILNDDCNGILMFNQNVTCEEFCRAEKKDQKRSPIIREGWTLYTRSVQFLCQSIVEIRSGYLVKVFKLNV